MSSMRRQVPVVRYEEGWKLLYPEGFFEKMGRLEAELSRSEGPFSLFALLSGETFPERWDLVLSAPGFTSSKLEYTREIYRHLNRELDENELQQISKVVILDPGHRLVQYINAIVQTAHEPVSLSHGFNGWDIDRAYIITSDPEVKAAAWPAGPGGRRERWSGRAGTRSDTAPSGERGRSSRLRG